MTLFGSSIVDRPIGQVFQKVDFKGNETLDFVGK